MKHFMQPKNTILREIHHSPSSTTSATSDTPPNSMRQMRSATTHTRRQILPNQENTNPNSSSPSISGKIKSTLPPRPPNPHKRKLLEVVPENGVPAFDSGVQVIVRVRPPIKEEEGELLVKKVSSDSLSINGQNFTFDSVADIESTQLDIFHLVGAPLVENCLAGFNSSVFAYGQTGSGKTYTIWGPANALLDKNLSSDQQGLTPRVFDRLFSRIREEQIKHADKQVKYQCRCSFLEIYNEQITDLLDPAQKNLHIREDIKSGVYVENLTEVTVYTMKDVTQLLLKGFSNRRIGATSINAESSRSHSVFTCVVESRGKSTADGVCSFKTSRINLVDLAGSERQKLTGATGGRLKEAGNINRSLSQLGNLINILADVSQTGKQRHIPYRDSRLTFLLQESLGGNAKLAILCAISPSQSCKSESFSTLRFAQRAKAIKNKAVVNEVMQDDVNVLRRVIRGLKDELVRMKGKVNSTDSNGGYSTGWNARRSLNLLRFSLNPQIGLARVDDDGDTEMEIVEDAVDKECLKSNIVAFREGNLGETQLNTTTANPINGQISGVMQIDNHETMGFGSEKFITNDPEFSKANVRNLCNQMEGDHEEGQAKVTLTVNDGELPNMDTNLLITSDYNLQSVESLNKHAGPKQTCSSSTVNEISVIDSSNYSSPGSVYVACVAPVKSPVRCVSLEVNNSRKSQRISLNSSASNAMAAVTEIHSSPAPTEHLAASLHRGLEIIDSHRQGSPLRRSPYRFPFKPADYEPNLIVEKVNMGVQTVPQHNDILADDSGGFLCTNCKSTTSQLELRDTNDNSNQQLVPVNGPESADKIKNQVPKAVEKVLAGAIRREMALEEFCSKQNAEVMQLNRLVQQYKHERECNAVIGQMREDKIARLERLMDGVLPTDEFMEEEFISLTNELKLLKEKYENHPEILSSKIELKRVQEELVSYKNFHDMGEKDVFLEEIQDLKTQLQYYIDSSAMSAKKRRPQPLCTVQDSNLAEELKIELKASRSKANKLKQELDAEKKCAEELKEAMQIAMEGNARMLEQYADLQEKHLTLLETQRKIHEGIDDVKKAAVKAGVRGTESKFINALAAEISALKVEREKERQYFRDENKELRAQLRDTADAVQTAGEILVRLKEAEEAVSAAQNRAIEAEEIDKAKKTPKSEMNGPSQCFPEHHLPEGTMKYDEVGEGDDGLQWREEFATFYNVDEVGDMSKLAESGSWFSGYDRCNI